MDTITHNHRLTTNESGQDLSLNPAATTLAESGPLSVLVVDDEEIVRLVLSEMLDRLGMDVVTVADGLSAVQVLQSGKPRVDLVIFDLTMPEMQGDELFFQIRRLNPGIKLVLSSGLFDDETVEELLEHGLDGYLPKPYNIEQISALLNSIFGRR